MRLKLLWIFLVVALACSTLAPRARALGSAGIDAGIAQRATDYNNNLPAVAAFGAHAEVDLGPLFRLGPYFLHYELPSNHNIYIYLPTDKEYVYYEKGTFNSFGLRARFILPVPGPIKPHASVGLGKTWYTHHLGNVFQVSHAFLEIPVGIGASYEVMDRLSVSLDAAYRPAVLFVGSDDDGHQASTGTSFLLGASLAF
jgi:hypothetical protein